MTYDTLDWDVEAKRVARAFGVEEECEFRAQIGHWVPLGGVMALHRPHDEEIVRLSSGLGLAAIYNDKSKWYYIQDEVTGLSCSASFHWDNSFTGLHVQGDLGFGVARALFYLDLLTPEIEVELKVTISAHEKLEWVREYEERYGL